MHRESVIAMTASKDYPGTGSSAQNLSYRLSICYDSNYGQHCDYLYIQRENIDAVIETLPAAVIKDLHTFADATSKTYDYIKGKLFNNDDQVQTFTVALKDFVRNPGHNIHIEPRFGRFYPATLFNSEKLVLTNRMLPVRVIGLMHEELLVNTSHPLSDYNTAVTLEKLDRQQYESSPYAQRLNARQIPDFLTGPGMQLRYTDKATDFFSGDAFKRADDTIDSEFYSQPRRINHLDEAARAQLKSVYSDLIPARSKVLDLMSSINSHIDDAPEIKEITGLGMNEEELNANPRLDARVVHDINQHQQLPFDDAVFDIVVCSLSIEYITQPLKLFDEAARILRPGGRFIISFSNRWFPAKAIQVWNNLHDFERIGLVMEYFIESAHFADINTCSLRGIPRPADDKHKTPLSDPVYVIWADRV